MRMRDAILPTHAYAYGVTLWSDWGLYIHRLVQYLYRQKPKQQQQQNSQTQTSYKENFNAN
jgi:hypothetical protein